MFFFLLYIEIDSKKNWPKIKFFQKWSEMARKLVKLLFWHHFFFFFKFKDQGSISRTFLEQFVQHHQMRSRGTQTS